MHSIVHEITAAIGGIVFIIIGITRQKERLRLISTGKRTEGGVLWTSLVVAGIFLVIFALGLMVYQLNHH